jgi:hypothetical protein
MDNDYKEKQEKGFRRMRLIYDIGMGSVIIFMGVFMVWGDKFGFEMVTEYDPLMRYLFGGLCLLYGGFRFYRAFKND